MRRTGCRNWLAGLAAGVLALAAAASAQTEPQSPQAKVAELTKEWSRSDRPGFALAVIRDGRTLYQGAHGMADLERGVSLTTRSVFEVGSVSKQFTAMCVLLLESRKKLSLDDDVRKYVPELPVYEKPITIRHLLHHTSGLRDAETLFPLAGMSFRNEASNLQILGLITRQRGLNFAPGSAFFYTNSGYVLLGLIVERISGRSLREFAEENIFSPLGMRDTVFRDDPRQIVKNRALAYSMDETGELRDETWELCFVGPAGVHTTVEDLARWDANFHDNKLGGGAELISKLLAPGKLDTGVPIEYAAGLFIGAYKGLPTVEHSGAWMGYLAEMLRFPDQRLTVICLSNNSAFSPSDMAYRVAELYLGELIQDPAPVSATAATPKLVELSPQQLEVHEGLYWNAADQVYRRILLREGKLLFVRGPGDESEMGPLGPDRFVMLGVDWPIEFRFESPGGGPRRMLVDVDQEPLRTLEVVEAAAPTAKDLAAYAGSYRSEDLGTELRLRLEAGQIVASLGDDERQIAAEPTRPEELRVPGLAQVPWLPQDGLLSFERDRRGKVTGLRLSTVYARNISFAKLAGP